MAFSPQSDRLAIAQSDNMVFIYKLGSDWGEKKSICNKFQHTSSISCLIWPVKRPNEIVYGLAEGKVKLGQIKTHKPVNLYQTESYVTAITTNCEGTGFLCAHLDGSIFVYSFESPERGARMLVRHSCSPFAICWASSIVVAGNSGIVTFYDEFGGEEQSLDMSDASNCKEFTASCGNPTGDSVVLGNYNSLYVFVKNKDSMLWENKAVTNVDNMYSVTAVAWKPDGDKITVGTLCGAVDLYDVCVKRTIYKGGFEITYVSISQVIVRQVETNTRIVVRSQYGREILKTNIFKNRFVVAHTSDTLLLGDLETLKLSEIQWHGDGSERFIFDNPAACMIYFAGELTVVEYGVDELLGSVRTAFVSSHVLSLRVNEKPFGHDQKDWDGQENKKLAFLLDSHSIVVKDLLHHAAVTVLHDAKIDWLELNCKGNLLLFRDKRRFLHLYNLEENARNQLLSFCTYVQWVPGSDVVVAQNRSQLCVWYNISSPDQVTTIQIKGEVEDIERTNGKTEVIVDEGISQAVYPLDESLIAFGTAVENRDYFLASEILDKLLITPEVEAMWKRLLDDSLRNGSLRIANRCSAALGDVSLSRYLADVQQIGEKVESETGVKPLDHFLVRSRLALVRKDFKSAETEILNQGQVEECINMYQKFYRHGEAIRVAELTKHSRLYEMRVAYFQYLIDSEQFEKAAVLKTREGDFNQAVALFLKGGMPGKAAQVVMDNDIRQPVQMLENIASALSKSGIHDKAGDFHERLNDLQRALECYIRGNAFRKAVELARKCFPAKVVELQELWGDFLVSQKQVDMAINHFIEAKAYKKGIESALNARQYARALQLVDVVDADTARPYFKQLARYYEDVHNYELAEKCYVSADSPKLAVEMHTRLGHWEIAHKIAMSYMTDGEVGLLYINQAQKFEQKGRLKDAEKLYLAVKEKDLAINMYKKHRRYDDMVRLVSEHRSDLLKETHQFLAQTLEMEGSLREAEHHYVEAQEWHSAVNMYRSNELWDDAIRVAKFYGGINACKRVTIALLMAIGVVEGAKYLSKHGLVEAAIEHASENGAFDLALELANHVLPKRLPDIHLKHALFLEDDERFREAEDEFIKAGKPKEAVDMYIHQHDWSNALRIAEQFDSSSLPDVYIAQAKLKAENGDFRAAEDLYISALKPELCLLMYQEADLNQDALRIAQVHLPHRVAEISSSVRTTQNRSNRGSVTSDSVKLGKSYESERKWNSAVESYLNVKSSDNTAELITIWERAVELARNHIPNRYVEISVDVSRRLADLGEEETAAVVLFECGRHEEAINLLLNAKKFDKARSLAKGNSVLKKRVDESYQSFLIMKEDSKELADLGQTESALEVLAKRGDWDRVWDLIAKDKVNPLVSTRYVAQRTEEVCAVFLLCLF
jgi:intraflagellar transport protein 172